MREIDIRPGHTLWDELAELHIVIDRPCGGRGTCRRCGVMLADGRQVLSCQYRTPGKVVIADELLPARQFDVLTANAISVEGDVPVAVADIGTTTVVLTAFFNGKSATRSFINPQRKFGADVMSRIRAATEGHADELRELILTPIKNELKNVLDELCEDEDSELNSKLPCKLIVSANTTMQHLFEGLSCEKLGVAPFVPESLELREWTTDFMGKGEGLEIVQLPGISAFVGADIVSGLSYIDILSKDCPQLFVDLGTNGEMVLGCKDRLLVTSTAAGPAFEGSGPAVKIHAAGMLKLLHYLLENGIMDSHGTLVDEYFDAGYPVHISDYLNETQTDNDEEIAILTQDDIRNIQMAKAAIFAGTEALLDAYGITAQDVGTVFLAGGFGHYLDPKDALPVGLLPKDFHGKIISAGNTSAAGAMLYLTDPKNIEARMQKIRKKAEIISLPDSEGFSERYIEAMEFPP